MALAKSKVNSGKCQYSKGLSMRQGTYQKCRVGSVENDHGDIIGSESCSEESANGYFYILKLAYYSKQMTAKKYLLLQQGWVERIRVVLRKYYKLQKSTDFLLPKSKTPREAKHKKTLIQKSRISDALMQVTEQQGAVRLYVYMTISPTKQFNLVSSLIHYQSIFQA